MSDTKLLDRVVRAAARLGFTGHNVADAIAFLENLPLPQDPQDEEEPPEITKPCGACGGEMVLMGDYWSCKNARCQHRQPNHVPVAWLLRESMITSPLCRFCKVQMYTDPVLHNWICPKCARREFINKY